MLTLHPRNLIISAIVLTFGCFTVQRNLLWRSPIDLIQHSIALYPQSYRLSGMLAEEYEEISDFSNAEKAYQETIKKNDLYSSSKTLLPRMKLIGLYIEIQEWQKAEILIESLPVDKIKMGIPRSYYYYYLKILSALNKKDKYNKVYQEGSKLYRLPEWLKN